MELVIQTNGIDFTANRKRFAIQKLDLALDRVERYVQRICLDLVDTNGPELGGVDKACKVIVLFSNQEPLVLEDEGEDVDQLIDRVTDRLGVLASKRADELRHGSSRVA